MAGREKISTLPVGGLHKYFEKKEVAINLFLFFSTPHSFIQIHPRKVRFAALHLTTNNYTNQPTSQQFEVVGTWSKTCDRIAN